MKNKLKAFTLIDVLGAMLISSIIVGAGLYFLTFVNDNKEEFKNAGESKYNIELIYETLNRLCLKADNITQNGSEIVFLEKNREHTVVLKNDFLTINTGKIDSLSWDLKDLEIEKIRGKNTIKSIRVEFNFDNKAFEWYFYKNFGKSTQTEIVER